MCVGQEASLDLKIVVLGNSAAVKAGPPVPGSRAASHGPPLPHYSAPELFSDFQTLSGDVWPIGVICSGLLHTQPGACGVWSDGDPRMEDGAFG